MVFICKEVTIKPQLLSDSAISNKRISSLFYPYKNYVLRNICLKTLGTLAQILAADTQGYRESAFLATVILILGNISDSLASYFSGGPTVSTYTSAT